MAWDKRPNESALAFRAFALYRDLGSKRSISQVARELGTEITHLKDWSSKHEWVARCDAYDAHIDRLDQQTREKERREMHQRHAAAGATLQGSALVRIVGRPAAMDKDGRPLEEVPPLDPNDIPIEQIPRFAEVGMRMERLAHGLPTDLTKAMNELTAAEVSLIVQAIVDEALARMPEEQHDGFIRAVKALGERRPG
jgi:hypothetical protein